MSMGYRVQCRTSFGGIALLPKSRTDWPCEPKGAGTTNGFAICSKSVWSLGKQPPSVETSILCTPPTSSSTPKHQQHSSTRYHCWSHALQVPRFINNPEHRAITYEMLAIFIVLTLSSLVSAICPGSSYGITYPIQLIPDSQENNPALFTWTVYESGCQQAENFTQYFNRPKTSPCNSGRLRCSPDPPNQYNVSFTWYKAARGSQYACGPNSDAESCNGHTIAVCCHNDK
ncbi:hypothetical protein BT63DRAFT_133242 [Microthyrium microscopicum]|uniref:Uncharacterized protein n=1 Tax=Microthyrium microscopicum TaxID=703497 RepID=A0A6A6UMK3_9PEZI|nr:hypothetical protein BT63DRAFT_133242 [Microthyrium microscopicum]